MDMALAQAILAFGIRDLDRAFGASASFAHVGAGELPWQPERLPGLPFPDSAGVTLLAVEPQSSSAVLWEPGKDFFAGLHNDMGKPEAVALINVNAVFSRVVLALGGDPEKVLREAYAEAVSAYLERR